MPSLVICFGEVLWDMFPTGPVPGGAPMNVAFHLNQFGTSSKLISRVGNDQLGFKLVDYLETKGISTDWVQRDKEHSTGTVKVILNYSEDVEYEISSLCAWDYIEKLDSTENTFQNADYLVFGSLASRNSISFESLRHLVNNTKAIKVLDVNLRQPFYTKDLIFQLLQAADIVKLNLTELRIITEWIDHGHNLDIEGMMHTIKTKYNMDKLIVTRGSKGAYELTEFLYHAPGAKVILEDPVGSGDAFLASYIHSLCCGEDSQTRMDKAAAVGAYVASQKGAIPKITLDHITKLLAQENQTL